MGNSIRRIALTLILKGYHLYWVIFAGHETWATIARKVRFMRIGNTLRLFEQGFTSW